MKAWHVFLADDPIEYSDIVFAETSGKAKAAFANNQLLDFTDVRCRRVPELDGEVLNKEAIHNAGFGLHCDNCQALTYDPFFIHDMVYCEECKMKIPQMMIGNVARCGSKEHTLKGRCGEHGIEIFCKDCDALILWPTPDIRELDRDKKMQLQVGLAMGYNVDEFTINHFLLEGGFKVVNNSNFEQAFNYVKNALLNTL